MANEPVNLFLMRLLKLVDRLRLPNYVLFFRFCRNVLEIVTNTLLKSFWCWDRELKSKVYFCAMQDTFKHKGMRRQLIAELRAKGIADERILSAFDAIPRHYFLDLVFELQAYTNQAFQIGAGQTISHPFTVAFQTQLLELKKGEKVLEIGTGSAFQTCILCELGMKVVSIERQRELFVKAKHILHHFHFNPRIVYGDGYAGWPALAPYDKILVTCGAPEIPIELVRQLRVGGIMVIPVGEGVEQKMLKIIKTDATNLDIIEYGTFSFVPMLEDKVR